jgi:FixJ family two-component response regulator
MALKEKQSRVYVVDDDESIRKTLTRIILFAGLEARGFGSAEEFLDGVDWDDCTCLILDMHLPGMSGIELQRRLNITNHKIPIIFISANADEGTLDAAMKAGAIGFFRKPFPKDSLLEALHAARPVTNP